jgi:hypothetical protein
MPTNGCGVIAAADLAVYTAAADLDKSRLRDRIPGLSTNLGRLSPFAYRSYAQLIRQMTATGRPGGFQGRGLRAEEFRRLVNMYALTDDQAGPTTVVGNMRTFASGSVDSGRKGTMLREQLGRDIPVPWFYATAAPQPQYSWESQSHVVGEDLLMDRDRDGVNDFRDYNKQVLPGYEIRPTTTANRGDDYYNLSLTGGIMHHFGNHYVNITEYIVDRVDGTKKVVFSSWGEKMVANLDNTTTGNGGLFEVF